MGLLGDAIISVLKVISLLAVVSWIVFFAVWMIKKKWGKIKFWWKYKVRKQQFDFEVVQWCESQARIGKTSADLEKEILLKSEGIERKDIEELLMIYNIVKQMKGGESDGKNKSKP